MGCDSLFLRVAPPLTVCCETPTLEAIIAIKAIAASTASVVSVAIVPDVAMLVNIHAMQSFMQFAVAAFVVRLHYRQSMALM